MHRYLYALALAGLLVLSVYDHGLFAAEPICGRASWYGHQHHGRLTATGERFDQWGMTAAMMDRSMFGKRVRVTNQANGKSVVVKINDTGNFAKYGRVIDMSRGSFAKLASTDAGVIRVCLTIL